MPIIRRVIDGLAAPFRWIFGWFLRFIVVPKKIYGLELATRIAVFVVLASYALFVLALVRHFAGSKLDWTESARQYLIDLWFIPVVMIPALGFITYLTLLAWRRGPGSGNSTLEAAWQEIVGILDNAGFPLNSELPVFLVLGCAEYEDASRLLKTSGIEFTIEGEPAGPQPIRVFAGKKGIFIVPSNHVGAVSRLRADSLKQGGGMSGQTMLARTIMNFVDDSSNNALKSNESMMSLRQSLSFSQTVFAGEDFSGKALPFTVASMQRSDIRDASSQLGFVCRSLKVERSGRIPVNAILVNLDIDLLDGESRKQLGEVISSDLGEVRHATQANAATIFLTSGLERDGGFMELVGHLGNSVSRSSRLGFGVKPIEIETHQKNLEVIPENCRQVFEKHIFQIFHSRGPDWKAGNLRLYALLCKVRGDVFRGIGQILESLASEKSSGMPGYLIGGWYFAATGKNASEQAFAGAVFHKLREHVGNGDCEWLEGELRKDERFYWMAQVLFVFCGVLLLVILAVLFGFVGGEAAQGN